jgi:molecular chaperone HscB
MARVADDGGRASEDVAVANRGAFGADGDDPDMLGHVWGLRVSDDTRATRHGSARWPGEIERGRRAMDADAFETLGLPARFDLDAEMIQRAYLAGSGAVHGDEAESARLNAARITLEDPEKRALLLLTRLSGPGKEADRSLPDGFLMEMMEVRERIEADRGDPGAMDRWEDWGEAKRQGHIAAAGKLFEQAREERPTPGPQVLAAIRRELNAWRYIERMLEQLNQD